MEGAIMILDFFGVPGSGKSTVSHQLAKAMEDKGLAVCQPSYMMDHHNSKIIRRIKKVCIGILWLLKNRDRTKSIIAIFREYCISNIELAIEFFNIAYKVYYIDKAERYDCVVFDEGITQTMISLRNASQKTINSDLGKLQAVVCNGKSFVNIYQNTSIDVALKRLKERKTNDSKIEREADFNKQINMMHRYKILCDSISTNTLVVCDGDDVVNSDKVEWLFRQVIK